jgi:hypothetical protein
MPWRPGTLGGVNGQLSSIVSRLPSATRLGESVVDRGVPSITTALPRVLARFRVMLSTANSP